MKANQKIDALMYLMTKTMYQKIAQTIFMVGISYEHTNYLT